MILISFPIQSEEISVPLRKGETAPYNGVLITKFQAADYVGAKTSLDYCLQKLNSVEPCPTIGDVESFPEAFFYFGGGLLLGAVAGYALSK